MRPRRAGSEREHAVATADLRGRVLEQARLCTEARQGAPRVLRRALAQDQGPGGTHGGPDRRALPWGGGAVSPGILHEDRVDALTPAAD